MSHSPWWRRPSPEQEGGEPSTDSKSSSPPSSRRSSSSRSSGDDSQASSGGRGPQRGESKGRGGPRRGQRADDETRAKKAEAGRDGRRKPKDAATPDTSSGSGPAGVVRGRAIVLCDVESVANALRDANLELEDAPAALAASAGEPEVCRVYALGNRFSRLRRVLEDAGYERVAVEGSPATLRMQIAVDAIDLSHRHPEAGFLLCADEDDIRPVVDRLLSEERTVALFGAEGLEELPEQPPRERAGRRDDADDDQDDRGRVRDGDDDDDDDDEDEESIEEAADEPTAEEEPSPEPAPRRRAARPRSEDRGEQQRKAPAPRARRSDDPFDLLLDAIGRIVQGPPKLVFESVVRQEILEVEPNFNEREAGFGSFTEFFEEAQEKGLIQLEREPSTGTYLVVGAVLPD